MTLDEALAAIDMMFGGGFGAAGAEVVVEEFMRGRGGLVLRAVRRRARAAARHRRRTTSASSTATQGPNTGGMGAYSPAPVMTAEMCAPRPWTRSSSRRCAAMRRRGTPFKGVLFAGLMITEQGPKLIEYNVRFGDPECQVLMLRMMSDLVPALLAACDGQLKNFDLRWYPRRRADRGDGGEGLSRRLCEGHASSKGWIRPPKIEGVEIFHAGTKAEGRPILANGGRVLNVCASARPWPRRKPALTRPSTASDGRKASAAAISAGGRWRGRRV